MRIRPAPAALALSGLLSACSLAPPYERPAFAVPAEWRVSAPDTGSLGDLPWWELFRDATLQELIRTALAESTDIQLAVARLGEARALLARTRSGLFPQLAAWAAVEDERLSERGFPPLPAGFDPQFALYETSLDVAFQLDLWGRLRSATAAARADVLASEEAQRSVTVTAVSDVAQAYFDLRELDRELDVATRTRETRLESLRIVELRAEHGVTSELDVRQAQIQLEAANAAIAELRRLTAQTENRLSVLMGRNPGAIPRGLSLRDQPVPPEIPAGLPSALLERRPDLREAEQRLVAANARIGEARAAFFPDVILTGAFGVQSVALSDLFTWPARLWQFGPAITVPIFTAGRLQAQLDATEARTQQALVQYRQAIQQAFREVDDALTAHQELRAVRLALERQVDAARRALDLAQLRYLNGLSSYLDVLEAQRQLFTSEVELARVERDQLVAVVQIYKALGGGWAASGDAAVSGG